MTLLIIYETYNDGTENRKTIKEYGTYEEALAIFHNEFAKAIPDSNVKLLTCAICGTTMTIQKRETYTNPTSEAE